MRKLIVAACVAALAMVVPTLAAAHEDQTHALDHVTCVDGTALTPPLTGPVCGDRGGIQSITCADDSVATPPFEGRVCPAGDGASDPSAETDSGDDDGASATPDDGAPTPSLHRGAFHRPRFKAAFLNRVWRITGEANAFADGELDFTAARFLQLPKKWSAQDDPVVGTDSRVLVTAKTRVYDADHHRIAADEVAADLDAADSVVVEGKIVPLAKWEQDEDGVPVPTLRAKRITIAG